MTSSKKDEITECLGSSFNVFVGSKISNSKRLEPMPKIKNDNENPECMDSSFNVFVRSKISDSKRMESMRKIIKNDTHEIVKTAATNFTEMM